MNGSREWARRRYARHSAAKGQKNTHRVEEWAGPSERGATFWSRTEVDVLGVVPGETWLGGFKEGEYSYIRGFVRKLPGVGGFAFKCQNESKRCSCYAVYLALFAK